MSSGQTKRQRRRNAAKASPQDHAVVPYLKTRDRFLEAADKTDHIEWLVAVGRFVQDRWLAEEATRKDGEDLDEHGCWPLWDQCTEKQIRDLRSEAGIALKAYVKRNGLIAITDYAARTFKPVKALLVALNWIFWQFLRGIVSGIAIILLGMALAAMFPDVVKRARGMADSLLPEATRADRPLAEQGQGRAAFPANAESEAD